MEYEDDGDVEDVQERPNKGYDAGFLWLDQFETYSKRMRTKGKRPKGYPRGAVIHYTSGRDNFTPIESGIDDGYCFNLITGNGKVWQTHPLDEWGNHAGKASWKGSSLINTVCVGIEVTSAGLLTPEQPELVKKGTVPWETTACPARAWFEKDFSWQPIRRGGDSNAAEGFYAPFTHEQVSSLTEYLIALKYNNPEIFDFDWVVGHDEVSPGRKTDPGACMPCSMPVYREQLKQLYKERYGSV